LLSTAVPPAAATSGTSARTSAAPPAPGGSSAESAPLWRPMACRVEATGYQSPSSATMAAVPVASSTATPTLAARPTDPAAAAAAPRAVPVTAAAPQQEKSALPLAPAAKAAPPGYASGDSLPAFDASTALLTPRSEAISAQRLSIGKMMKDVEKTESEWTPRDPRTLDERSLGSVEARAADPRDALSSSKGKGKQSTDTGWL
jgi:hypothetical protein